MTLYEMTANAQYLYQLLEGGEIDEEVVQDSLESMCVADKLEDYCKVIRQFEADAEAYKAEKDFFAAKEKKARRSVERLQSAIRAYMAVVGKDEERCGKFTVKVGTSKATRIVDGTKIPAEYFIPQPPTIDKAAIRAALLAGGEVAGAELQINHNIKIK